MVSNFACKFNLRRYTLADKQDREVTRVLLAGMYSCRTQLAHSSKVGGSTTISGTHQRNQTSSSPSRDQESTLFQPLNL
jgi:hypothetical protein